ncbi:MAG: hypothetical protein ACON4R_16960 [Akkermansiaceae bacterium]
MIHPRPKSWLSLPLLLAVGLIFGVSHISRLVHLEHLVFPPLERWQPESYYLEGTDEDPFTLKVWHFKVAADHPANIGTYLVDDEAREIMGSNEGDPVEWAQFIRQNRLSDDRLIAITSSLSWPEAEQLPLLALQEQIDLTPCLVVGLKGELLNIESPLPSELESSVIPAGPLPEFSFPEIDFITVRPSVNPPLFGISEVRGFKIERKNGSFRLPMIIRWGNHLLPSLQLASLLTIHRLKPSDLRIDPQGFLRLGETGPIIRIDSAGCVYLPSGESKEQSASFLQVYPTRAETTKIIENGTPPIPARGLESQLRSLHGNPPELVKTYKRLPVFIEMMLVFFPAFILQSKRSWLYLPVVAAIGGISILLSYRLLFSPYLLLFITACIQRLTARSPE